MKQKPLKKKKVRETEDKSIFSIPNTDRKKISTLTVDIKKGIENYSLFHFFPQFHWPAWVMDDTGRTSDGSFGLQPPLLLNKSRRHWASFSTLLSSERMLVDSSLMIFTSHGSWAIEPWLISEGKIIRPFLAKGKPEVFLDPENSFLHAQWTYGNISLTLEGFCARLEHDEAVFTLKQKGRNKKGDALLLVVRPYNADTLGNLFRIEYDSDSRIVKADGNEAVFFSEKPYALLSGNGKNGDVDGTVADDLTLVDCRHGLASLAAAYQCKPGEQNITFRMLLSRGGKFSRNKFDLSEAREEFAKYISLRIKSGTRLKISDKKMQKWFSGLKLILSNKIDVSEKSDLFHVNDFQQILIVKALIASGFLEEASRLVQRRIGKLVKLEKGAGFDSIMPCCATVVAFTDYYNVTRDSDLLQNNYHRINQNGGAILQFVHSISSLDNLARNSIDLFYRETGHLFDVIILCNCLDNLAYLSRSMGMFGDEKKYENERSRLSELFLSSIKDFIEDKNFDPFFFYSVFASYPFSIKEFSPELLGELLGEVENFYRSFPLVVPSFGADLLSSALVCSNFLHLGRKEALESMSDIMKYGDKLLFMPDFINPGNGQGCYGNGASIAVSAACFLMMRNMVFLDNEGHLDLFPAPKEEWFRAGKELTVENAPTRFGRINFSVKCTSNEINIYFEELPRFVPPEIRITLPFSFKVKEGEEFIIKKQLGNTVFINGWPSILKILRK